MIISAKVIVKAPEQETKQYEFFGTESKNLALKLANAQPGDKLVLLETTERIK